jgi:hypothetical protein
MPREIPLDALTVDDLVNLGESAVNDRLPKSLLLTIARLYVHDRRRQRARQSALAAERRAYRIATGEETDGLVALVNQAAMDAAARLTFDWTPLLDVPFLVPSLEHTVTWGAATIDHHADRAGWLEDHAAGSLRTAVQHRAAIDDIEQHGAFRLMDFAR